jgi:hypothetical protein
MRLSLLSTTHPSLSLRLDEDRKRRKEDRSTLSSRRLRLSVFVKRLEELWLRLLA